MTSAPSSKVATPPVAENFLLPAGLADGLPPEAGFEAAMVERLMASFARWGYERVKPPLLEFEDSLLAGPGEAMAAHTFRLMDPVSQRMMGLRADMTPQVGRIAASRLRKMPRPLRLSYAGQVLRVKGEQMRLQRQLGQVGVELIGAEGAAADAEVLLLPVEALRELGAPDVAVDINVPRLAPIILADLPPEARMELIAALDRKDTARVSERAGRHKETLLGLLRSVGPVETALPALLALKLPAAGEIERANLAETVALVRKAAPDLTLTIDATDQRGFEYHSGLAFTLLGRGVRGEFGRGGRYVNHAGEAATGFSLYLDTLLATLPVPARPKRVFVPFGAAADIGMTLRREGWVTVQGLSAVADARLEAKRLLCSHVLEGGRPVAVDG
ncbi:ATP phosphoribosyltransferase regulatory subunit [Dongia mobilis]|uniref:ATP phosphoribosyltransferase regulatory subunit n=1 Tax=Dongia mobilis TaxID=578943 RepID=A0A4R6WNH9_9PROT|nr:ATP phosphoribosyltransferase regulatory subunit [Dongia mobilis]TDQ80510.1 ATP phosphoribosyltransferase regulatory subunit [Dongia mobilis]